MFNRQNLTLRQGITYCSKTMFISVWKKNISTVILYHWIYSWNNIVTIISDYKLYFSWYGILYKLIFTMINGYLQNQKIRNFYQNRLKCTNLFEKKNIVTQMPKLLKKRLNSSSDLNRKLWHYVYLDFLNILHYKKV